MSTNVTKPAQEKNLNSAVFLFLFFLQTESYVPHIGSFFASNISKNLISSIFVDHFKLKTIQLG